MPRLGVRPFVHELHQTVLLPVGVGAYMLAVVPRVAVWRRVESRLPVGEPEVSRPAPREGHLYVRHVRVSPPREVGVAVASERDFGLRVLASGEVAVLELSRCRAGWRRGAASGPS